MAKFTITPEDKAVPAFDVIAGDEQHAAHVAARQMHGNTAGAECVDRARHRWIATRNPGAGIAQSPIRPPYVIEKAGN